MSEPIRLGVKIRDFIRKKGVTVDQFEDDTGIAKRILYPCYGFRVPRKATLMALAYYFNTTVSDIISGTDVEDIFSDMI